MIKNIEEMEALLQEYFKLETGYSFEYWILEK